MDILDYYKYDNISKERELELFKNIESKENREEIIKSHLKLVAKIAKRYSFLSPDLLEDLTQEGTLGLIESIFSFNPSLGFRFSTFAAFRIRNNIRKSLRKAAFSFYVPSRKIHLAFSLSNKIRETENMSITDICDVMKCEPSQAEDLLFIISCTEEPLNENSVSKEIDTNHLDKKLKMIEINELLSYFCSEDRKIIELRYDHNQSWRQIAKSIGMSHEGCRKRHYKIISLIKSQIFHKKDYLEFSENKGI